MHDPGGTPALPPVPPAGPSREVTTMRYRILMVGLAAILLTGVGAVFGLRQGASPTANTAEASSSLPPGQAPVGQLAGSIARAQEHLRAVPRDYVTWAALGSEYVESARVTADLRITRRPKGRYAAHSNCGPRGIRPPWSGSGRSL